ncbi:hypothetical protein [Streptomyces sp. A5-4]
MSDRRTRAADHHLIVRSQITADPVDRARLMGEASWLMDVPR